ADFCSHRNDVITFDGELLEQVAVLGITANEAISRMGLVTLFNWSVFGKIVDADDAMSQIQKLLDEITGNETRRTGNEDRLGFRQGRSIGHHQISLPVPASNSRRRSRFCPSAPEAYDTRGAELR